MGLFPIKKEIQISALLIQNYLNNKFSGVRIDDSVKSKIESCLDFFRENYILENKSTPRNLSVIKYGNISDLSVCYTDNTLLIYGSYDINIYFNSDNVITKADVKFSDYDILY